MLMYAGTQKAGSTWLHAVLVAGGMSTGPDKEWHVWDRALGMRTGPWWAGQGLGRPPTWAGLIDWMVAETRPVGDVPLASLAPLGHRRLWRGRTPLGVRALRRGEATLGPALRFLAAGGPWSRSVLDEWVAWMRVWDVGDFTPGNVVLSRSQWAELVAAVPDLRVVMSVRNPTQRLWSFVRAKVRRGRVVGEPMPEEAVRYSMVPLVRERSFASVTLEHLRAVLPEERLFVVTLDDISESGDAVAERLGRFVGRPLRALPPKKVGPVRPMPRAVEEALDRHFREELERLESLVGRPLRA